MMPWYPAGDASTRERVEKLFQLARARFDRHAKWFAGFAERGRVSEIAGPHHLFLTHARQVIEQIDAFVTGPSSQPSK